MPIQYITDAAGLHTFVVIPIIEWELITSKYEELKSFERAAPKPKVRLSALAGKLSCQTAEMMLKHLTEGRSQWEERLKTF